MTGQDLAAEIIALVRERDALREQAEAQAAREQDIARRMYRRGYRTGFYAGQRGRDAVTNPERNARGELRQLLDGVAA